MCINGNLDIGIAIEFADLPPFVTYVRFEPVPVQRHSSARPLFSSSWLALVRSDLETMGYAMGAVPIEAASAGAEHFRDRCWFVADYDNSEWRTDDTSGNVPVGDDARWQEEAGHTSERRPVFVEHASHFGWGKGWTEHEFRSPGVHRFRRKFLRQAIC